MEPGQKPKIHYAWVTLGATCVMMAIGFGMALNSMGVFFPAVAGYLGTGTGAVASFMTIQGLCMVVGMVFVGRIVPKYWIYVNTLDKKSRKIMLLF
ncbi:MAG: MFS transporter [Lachnospiraceae bacterium]|nr:MFS transporter [Lachnospiraceae bacterium]